MSLLQRLVFKVSQNGPLNTTPNFLFTNRKSKRWIRQVGYFAKEKGLRQTHRKILRFVQPQLKYVPIFFHIHLFKKHQKSLYFFTYTYLKNIRNKNFRSVILPGYTVGPNTPEQKFICIYTIVILSIYVKTKSEELEMDTGFFKKNSL